MTPDSFKIEVSRIIHATPSAIFQVLADPQRHSEFDGSDMLRGSTRVEPLRGVGDVFTMRMRRMGRDYLMVNRIVEFAADRRIVWEPAPGDVDTAGGDPKKIGVPAGYQWGFSLVPTGDDATVVTELFDCGPKENHWILDNEDGKWINGSQSVNTSLTNSLERLAAIFLK